MERPYIVDRERREAGITVGIYVRARMSGRWINADVAWLDKASLLRWLRAQGGDNPLAEDILGIVLDHGPLHDRVEAAE